MRACFAHMSCTSICCRVGIYSGLVFFHQQSATTTMKLLCLALAALLLTAVGKQLIMSGMNSTCSSTITHRSRCACLMPFCQQFRRTSSPACCDLHQCTSLQKQKLIECVHHALTCTTTYIRCFSLQQPCSRCTRTCTLQAGLPVKRKATFSEQQ